MACPVGSVICGTEEDIHFAGNMRKMLGGGMRQAGLTAACALVALEDWQEVLSQDNANARFFAQELSNSSTVQCDPSLVQTNMFSFSIVPEITNPGRGKKGLDHMGLCKILNEKHNILMFPSFFNDMIRVVTHRDVDQADIITTKNAIEQELMSYL